MYLTKKNAIFPFFFVYIKKNMYLCAQINQKLTYYYDAH